jgi:ketosteroid isomerase-like protein
MNREWAEAFATKWIAAWNDRDVERVLALFSNEVTFTSPTAFAVTGAATVRGKSALRDYWNTALSQIGSLRFSLDRVVWDPHTRELAILYVSDINGQSKRVSENLTFGVDGLVVSAEVFHGIGVA